MERRRWKVWLMVRHPRHEDGIRALEAAGCEVIQGRAITDARLYTEGEMVEGVRDLDGLMYASGESISRRVLESGKRLLVVSGLYVGLEKIDVAAATDLGILVTHRVRKGPSPVAEFTVGLILAMAKRFKLADRDVRSGLWRSVDTIPIWQKTVGIVGLGFLGSRVAELMRPFGVKLVAYDPYVAPEKARAQGVEIVDLATLLKTSDFVSLHVRLTPETKGLIGEAQLKMMKPDAYLINTARGALIDEAALARALKESRIAGAALDVFDPEVPQPGNLLLSEDIFYKTFYSAHVAGQTPELPEAAARQVEDCLRVLRGELPDSLVNPEAIPRWRERRKALMGSPG